MWSTGEGNGKPLQYSCLENPMNSMKRQNDRILKEELPRSVGAQYATEDQWRNNSRKNEGMEPEEKQYPVVDVTGDRSKVRCFKEQYCIGNWNVSSMNQGKLKVVKQEMARVNINILGISQLKWTGKGEFNSVQFSRSVVSDSLRPHESQHARPPCPLSVSYHFAFSYCSWGSQGKNTEVVCHSLLQWTTFCQTSPP